MNTESYYEQLRREILREFDRALTLASLDEQRRPAADIVEEYTKTKIRELTDRIAAIQTDSEDDLELIGFTEFVMQVYTTTAAREAEKYRHIARERREATRRDRIRYRRVTRRHATSPTADNELQF